ncbi:fused MFS/spermidine synthase [Aquabacterium sp.]|uniref:fused MFS/spermidine synthase n=1 Tax=Aquabacterium sp. TaxID=1872578 RepID=UPI0019AB051C|nr:fused MFS/spermidine synthase [Aquabacterium sp.]MBC7699708.1 fused MFS/spermidine synthase [Aquabacterium sp.]
MMPEFEESHPFTETNALKPFISTDDDSMSMQFDLKLIQSRMRLEDPIALDLQYTRAMMAFLMLNPEPRSILMVGLGGGSLAKYCHAHLPHADITVVEINPHVIEVRDAFKVPPESDRFRVVCGDGADFIAKAPKGSHDLIMIDGFNYEGQPETLVSIDFYKSCRKALAESGILVVNLQDIEPECTRLVGRIWQVFGEPVMALDIECGGNRIVVASTEEVFRECAGSFGRRWAALSVEHKETLRFSTASIEYELEPWQGVKKVAKAPKAKKRGR